MKKISAFLVIMICIGLNNITLAADNSKPLKKYTYVGVDTCAACHEKQYKIWKNSAHSMAYDVLDAKQKNNPDCIKCHTTGDSKALPGVQCEACHGPGSGYADMDTMKNFKNVWHAGLIRPNADTCLECHNKKSPTFNGFDFKEYWIQIMH